MVQDETDVQHKTQCNSSWWQVSNHKIYWFHFKHYSNVTDDGRSCNLQKYLTYKKRTLLVIVKFMTNHDNFFSQYFLSVLDPLLGSPARYQKISRPPFTRGSRGYAAAQPMFKGYIMGGGGISLVYSPETQYIPETRRVEGIYWSRGSIPGIYRLHPWYDLFIPCLGTFFDKHFLLKRL